MPRRSARVSKANATPHWRLPLPWEQMDCEDERREVYLKARDDLGYPPLRTADDLNSAVMGWVTRPVLEAWYFDPDPAVRRYALWLEVEQTRRCFLGIEAVTKTGRPAGLEGFGPDGHLFGPYEDPRVAFARLNLRPHLATASDRERVELERSRAVDQLAGRVARFGFVVSPLGAVDTEVRSASGTTTRKRGSA